MRPALLALVLVASTGCGTRTAADARWTPHLEGRGSIGEGLAWQAGGVQSNVIIGQPVTHPSNRLLREAFAPAPGIERRSQARRRGIEPSK
jgi:hypothetical protein